MSQTCQSLLFAAGLAAASASGAVYAQEAPVTDDPYAWLEDVEGKRALDWVHARNAKTEAELAATPQFKQLESSILAILDSNAKIPGVEKIGAYYYNFWKDAQHQRGLWRRTTLEEYRKDQPKWETVIDLDALNAQENEQWVWHGAECLRPEYQRCLIALSRGGSDADVTREFDLTSKTWIKDGFFRPEAKGNLSWIDRDHVYVATDFGKGTMTTSGYARTVRLWKRGTPMAEATPVYEGKDSDMSVAAWHDPTEGFERDFVQRALAFYNDELYLRGQDGKLTKIDLPNSANKFVHREWLIAELRDPYEAGGKKYASGSLIAINFDDFLKGKRGFTTLFAPTDTTSLASAVWTRHHLVVNVLDDVKYKLSVLTPPADAGAGEWTRSAFVGAPAFGTVSVGAVDSDDSDAVWLSASDYVTPTTLALADIGKPPQTLKTNPTFFDSSKDTIEQHFAKSEDGTRVPYFVVRPKDLKFDGKAPTLLYGYGGFEISLTPAYSGGIGKGWLEKGGVYAVANIRGGGEYGPRWHQAALKANRHKAYEDFAAVGRDLIARKITSTPHLGVQGGSNGGLLTGNMLTQYPELFGAVVVQVPLLDMKRYNHLLAGASWMAEYGNPDTADWSFIKTFSPYHLFDAKREYPPVIFMTSTKDDRVHPGHARKMAAKMLDAGKNVTYYENVEGGHGGAANNAQQAHMNALAYTFLWEQLAK
ncbi:MULTISPECIES: prolyl oligopeptidase family serine peptidase [Lysobacter]|uniref:prolyl oligopeptidase family serine peptidase n=1 Tax=Lysobacter TaxID=68 RepID=UPI001F3B4415|nr:MULTISPECIES: prolyl oligopeptidase family serine peptidase [Lysobacter]UJB22015.1 prolyl oligopeptidase family serine peptidase [Lysobacter capsici]UJQ31049.1 prolyl oligopeptidase family serine peptidase [Lysobacter gummosus]